VPPTESKRDALEAAERLQRTIEERCRVVACPMLAEIDSSERKMLDEGIGAPALESVVLGAASSRIVWTDDYVVALIGREKFGTKRVWTQGVLRWLNSQGIITNERYARASARLLGWQYMFTSVNPEVMRAAGNLGDWRPEQWPLKQAIAYLSLDDVRSQDAALFSAMLIAHCYLDAVVSETRRFVVQAAAEGLTRRTDAQKTLALFRTILGRAFGLNAPGLMDAMQTFDAWTRESLRRVSIVRS